MIISVTGHRKWNRPVEERDKLFSSLDTFFRLLACFGFEKGAKDGVTLIHGCAVGVDLWFGRYAIENGYPLELYLPFKRTVQIAKARMGVKLKRELEEQISYANSVIIVNKKFSTYGYQRRNIALVNRCDLLVSWYTRVRSGSGNCIRYALGKRRAHFDLRKLNEIEIDIKRATRNGEGHGS